MTRSVGSACRCWNMLRFGWNEGIEKFPGERSIGIRGGCDGGRFASSRGCKHTEKEKQADRSAQLRVSYGKSAPKRLLQMHRHTNFNFVLLVHG